MTYPFANKIIVVSKGVKSDLIEISNNLNKKIKVIYNPLNKKKNLKSIKNLSLKNKIWGKYTKYRILNVGSLKVQKDHFNLIKAFMLLKSTKNSRMIIIGDGPLRGELNKFIQFNNLKDRVFFIKFKSELKNYYGTADVFVLSSRWEGFSNVIAESLGYGLPVVSTNCKSGPSEILKAGKFGKLVPIENPKKLSNAIDESLREKHDKKELIKRSLDFEIGKISAQYLKFIYNEK